VNYRLRPLPRAVNYAYHRSEWEHEQAGRMIGELFAAYVEKDLLTGNVPVMDGASETEIAALYLAHLEYMIDSQIAKSSPERAT
jgi:hypothetical protein